MWQEKDSLSTTSRRAIQALAQRVSQSQEEGLLSLSDTRPRQFNHTILDLRSGSFYQALEQIALVAQDSGEDAYLLEQRQHIYEAIQYIYSYLFLPHFSASLAETAYLIPKSFELHDPVAEMLNRARLRIGRPDWLLSYRETYELLHVNRADLYTFIAAGRLHPIKEGKDRRWMDQLEVKRLQEQLERDRRDRERQKQRPTPVGARQQ